MPNLYATLDEYKTLIRPTGNTLSTDVIDDGEIVRMLEAASRFINGPTGAARKFYPEVKALLYDAPIWGDDELWFDEDLLSLTTLTNGDLTVIASTDYVLKPTNHTPYYMVKPKASSGVKWTADADNNIEDAISILGVWGYHEDYTHAWPASGAVLTAAIADTTTLTFACTTGKLSIGHIVKIDNEIMNVVGVTAATTDTITVQFRGDNGSTAATHLNGATVYVWDTDARIKDATLQIAKYKYNRRYGQNMTDNATITSGGVVISPRDIPGDAYQEIMGLRKVV